MPNSLIPLLSFILVLLSGCGPHIQALKQDPAFNYANITDEGLSIMGVSSAPKRLQDETRSQYGETLYRELLEQRRQYPLYSPGEINNALGSAAYRTLLNSYRTNTALSSGQLDALSQALKSRFVLLSRIESNEIRQSRQEHPLYDDKGKAIKDKHEIELSSARDLSISVRIYDLESRNVVWQAELSDSATESNRFEPLSTRSTLLDIVVGGITGSYDYPDPPSTRRLVKNIFSGLADKLPKK